MVSLVKALSKVVSERAKFEDKINLIGCLTANIVMSNQVGIGFKGQEFEVIIDKQGNSSEKKIPKGWPTYPIWSSEEIIGILALDNPQWQEQKDFREELIEIISNNLCACWEMENLAREKNKMNYSVTALFTNILDKKNSYTHGHCERVAEFAVALGRWLNLDEKCIGLLKYGGLLHDLGKIQIEDQILNKPSSLSFEEYEIIKTHPKLGLDMIRDIYFFQHIAEIIYYHHERYDGCGYPEGLKGEEIPILARIVAVVDAFDAMTSKRSYGRSLSVEEAFVELESNSYTQFDPVLVQAFKKCWFEGMVHERSH